MVEMDERRPWNAPSILLLIGPGGAGKSSVGSELAPLLKRDRIDLDEEFRRRMGDISDFIAGESYKRYKMANSALAAEIAAEAGSPTLLIASSGFLTPDNPGPALQANRRLFESCYSVCLLPSRDLETAIEIIVERQLARPFGRGGASEEATIRLRYPIYAGLGDLVVFSAASPRNTASAIARRFSAGS